MSKQKTFPLKTAIITILATIVILAAAFFAYTADYYRADGTALAAAKGSETVSVRQTDGDLFFDGPGEESLLIFYPGAKVEYTAYAPLMLQLSENGLDCVIVKMPFNLAVFGASKADAYLAEGGYSACYLGGHSLGGAIAASYASKHPDALDGLILLASYPVNSLKAGSFRVLSVYGSEDRVLNREKLAEGDRYMPADYTSLCIEGANHAQFGSYGRQSGDGTAAISPEAQWTLTKDAVLSTLSR